MPPPLDPPPLDLDLHAAITVALAEGKRPRADILGEHGLDEASWTARDDALQTALSRAINEDDEGIPPLLVAFTAAFDRARAASRAGEALLPLERFAEATREIQRRGDPVAALSHLGITLADYLRANEHWTRAIMADPELATRFRRGLLR